MLNSKSSSLWILIFEQCLKSKIIGDHFCVSETRIIIATVLLSSPILIKLVAHPDFQATFTSLRNMF